MQAGDRRGVLQRRAGHLGRVDDAGLEHVDVLVLVDVVADSSSCAFLTSITTTEPSTPALFASVRSGSSSARRTMLTPTLLVTVDLDLLEGREAADQRDAAARDDPLFHRRAGGVEGVLDAGLLLLHLGLGRRADVDHGDAAGQLRETLLQLLLVVVRGRLLDLPLDQLDAGLDVGRACRRPR